MTKEIIRPVDEATAKAVEQTAILGQRIVDAVAGGGRYVAEVLGRLPHNLVGIADDRVLMYRARRWIEMNENLEADLLTRGTKERIEPSFTVLMPLLEAAVDENRTELKQMWRRLLANAYDPARSSRVRASFIEIAKRLDPYDSVVLQKLGEAGGAQLAPNTRDHLKAALRLPEAEIMVSFANLRVQGLVQELAGTSHNVSLTDKGNLFFAAVAP